MMYITVDKAFEIESCIKKTHIAITRSLTYGRILETGDGAACFAGNSSFFSQVVGWGFNIKNKKDFKMQVESIEHFYRSLGHKQVDIELSPLVGIDTLTALGELHYKVSEWSNISYKDLQKKEITLVPSLYDMKEISADDLRDWSYQVALGFGHLQAQEQFYQYGGLKNVTCFAAYDKGQIIAGATIAIHDGVADLGVTSTLPSYRGKGLQKALIYKRLHFIQQLGIPLAIVTTEPGSISDLNIQKAGFHCAYTRIKFTKSLIK